MSKEQITISEYESKKFYCEDYNDKKGCGVQFKHIRNETTGKSTPCNPVQLPCLDKEGNTVYVYVPHWITCAENREYLHQYMRDKAEKQARWKEENSRGGNRSFERGAKRLDY